MAANVSLPVLFATYCVPLLICAGCAHAVQQLAAQGN